MKKTIKEFLAALSVNLGAADKDCKFKHFIDSDKLFLSFRNPVQGKRQCINDRQLIVLPDQSRKHHMLVEEIWYGYDAEGYVWSDNMGGRIIDCTGLSRIDAMTKLVNTIKNNYVELFTKGF
jgi:hypothetical protein